MANFRQIDVALAVQVVPLGEPGGELLPHFWSHFETAGADRRAKSGDKVLRVATERGHHPFDGSNCHSRNASPPAGMDCGHGALFRIRQEDRKAVCGFYRDADSSLSGDERVSFQPFAPLVARNHQSGMDLFQFTQDSTGMGQRRAESMLQPVFDIEQW